MASDCGSWVAKYLLCIFNFLFFILGSIVLGVGIWLAADKASFIALLKMVENDNIEQFTQPAVIEQMAYVLIACGALMFLLSFLGYCGAIRESSCMLTTYGILIIIVLIVQITIGGLAAVYKDRARLETKNFLQSTISRYYTTPTNPDAVSLMWNNLMMDLDCCGVNDYRDFEQSPKWTASKHNRTVPDACCKYVPSTPDSNLKRLLDDSCPSNPSELNSNYRQGCYEKLSDWIISHRNIIIIVGVGIGVIELLLIFLSFCLCKTIDRYSVMRL